MSSLPTKDRTFDAERSPKGRGLFIFDELFCIYENAAECPILWTGMNAAVFEFDRQDILVLHSIFGEAGKPRLSVKPRLQGGVLHYETRPDAAEAMEEFAWQV